MIPLVLRNRYPKIKVIEQRQVKNNNACALALKSSSPEAQPRSISKGLGRVKQM